MEYAEYRRYDAAGLAELVAKREVSAEELVTVALDRARRPTGRSTRSTVPCTTWPAPGPAPTCRARVPASRS
jgi:Asp-tRNA(Asn)/Glu-tRNA(Gln) amidotransferase A subunit family amidase